VDGKRVLIIEEFHEDLIKASEKLIKLIDKGEIRQKPLESSLTNLGT
jgi:hypothetical protein